MLNRQTISTSVWRLLASLQFTAGGAAMLLVALICVGCEALKISKDEPVTSTNHKLASLAAGQDAVQLNIVFIERPADDPLIGEALWNGVDEIGTLSVDRRSELQRVGFRTGLVGSNPPRQLQRLIGLNTEITDFGESSREKRLIGRNVILRSGAETEIQTSPFYPELKLMLPGKTEKQTFLSARCVMNVKMERTQDGWVTLHFTPELHHGPRELRRVAGDNGWELKSSQQIEAFPNQRFRMTLNVGEMVLLGARDDVSDSLGEQFYHASLDQAGSKRIIVVRLADMQRIQPIYREET